MRAGELAERSNAADLKSVSPQGLGGSNPSLSAASCIILLGEGVRVHEHLESSSRSGPARRALPSQGRQSFQRLLHAATRLQAGSEASAGFRASLARRSQTDPERPGGFGLAPDARWPLAGAGWLEPRGS